MSSKKGSQDNITTKETATVTPVSSPKSFLEEQHQSIDETLDETKNNINKVIEGIGRDVPHNTKVINDYQEHTIQILTEIADSYLQSQKEIIKSFQSAWVPYIENAYGMLYVFCPSPRKVSEIYTRVISNFVDNLMIITKLVNNAIFANLEASKILLQHRTECIKELSRIGINATRTFEHISTDRDVI
jgi:sugar-specific transcriptional regulator TrmB